MEQTTSATIGRETVRRWFARHPEILTAVLLFIASNLLIYTLAAFTHWLPGARRTNAVDFCRWDCNWFAIVLDQGYELTPNHVLHHDMANWAFFPLFPATAFPFRQLLGLPTSLALVVASRLALFTAILSFLGLAREEEVDHTERFAAGALVAFNPYVIYAYSGYSEPLYFWLLIGTPADIEENPADVEGMVSSWPGAWISGRRHRPGDQLIRALHRGRRRGDDPDVGVYGHHRRDHEQHGRSRLSVLKTKQLLGSFGKTAAD